MQITREYRNDLLNQSKPVQQYLYSSPFSGGALLTIANKYHLNDIGEYKKFAMTIGDIILGFYKMEDTVPLLQQELGIDAKTAALLGADVLDFLAPLSDTNWQPPTEEDAEDSESAAQIDTVETDSSLSTINEPEVSITSNIIPELRTMAADMQQERSPARSTFNAAASLSDEPMYTSTQPTLERPATEAPSYAAPLYQPPKPNVDAPLEKPRWG